VRKKRCLHEENFPRREDGKDGGYGVRERTGGRDWGREGAK
jgi:hypothetical protein